MPPRPHWNISKAAKISSIRRELKQIGTILGTNNSIDALERLSDRAFIGRAGGI